MPNSGCQHTGEEARQQVAPRLLAFWSFFHAHAPTAARAALSVRDLLAWANFINTLGPQLGPMNAYVHGAHLILLDGIGPGIGHVSPGKPTSRSVSSVLLDSDRIAQSLRSNTEGQTSVSRTGLSMWLALGSTPTSVWPLTRQGVVHYISCFPS